MGKNHSSVAKVWTDFIYSISNPLVLPLVTVSMRDWSG